MTLSPRDRELKLATGDLADELGGIERTAEAIGKGKSHVHRCTSINDAESFLNLRDAAEGERRSAAKPVTRLLCKLAGGVFLPLPEAFEDAGELPLLVLRGADEFGDVCARVREAVADRVVKPAEAGAIEREIDELIDWAVQARSHVRALQGKPAAPFVQLKVSDGEPLRQAQDERG